MLLFIGLTFDNVGENLLISSEQLPEFFFERFLYKKEDNLCLPTLSHFHLQKPP